MPTSAQQVIPVNSLTLNSTGTAVNQTLPDRTRGILVGTAGTLNVTIAGVAHDLVPFVAGITPGFFQSIQAGGTASVIWSVT